MPDQNTYKKYYDLYFGNDSESTSHMINLFRKEKTDKTEIAATLLACFLELQNNKEPFSEMRLLELFYAWSERKGQYNEKTVLAIWEWMEKKE